MRLYNTATRSVERFRPRTGEPVTVYVCGITPYDTTHLGHAFTYVVFDVLMRHLEVVHGWPVRYVQNVTDIDDDVLRRAARDGEDWRELGRRWTERFTTDMATLNVRPPFAYPGATSFIDDIQRHVQRLIEAGVAYERSGSVYFSAGAWPALGALSGLDPDAMLAIANARGNDPDDPNKRDPLDFVLWQAGRPDEPAWASPWGFGRPGWHIECSTMAQALLGAPLDIHGGGADLLFPHHSCEVAQCEAIHGVVPWVRFWVHSAMVCKDGEKMSKSLGNLVMVRDLLAEHEPDVVRLYLLRHHYRDPWEWHQDRFLETAGWVRTLWAAMGRASGRGAAVEAGAHGPRFTAAMDDDLNTPRAVTECLAIADEILGSRLEADVAPAQDVLRTVAGRVLGLWLGPVAGVPPDVRAAAAWPAPRTAPPDRILAGDGAGAIER